MMTVRMMSRARITSKRSLGSGRWAVERRLSNTAAAEPPPDAQTAFPRLRKGFFSPGPRVVKTNGDSPVLRIGSDVEAHGLVSEAGSQLNGQRGKISGFDAESGRYMVRFDHGSSKKLKADNLRSLAE